MKAMRTGMPALELSLVEKTAAMMRAEKKNSTGKIL
jgi:hypothetical protein